jgi:general secretion pathway protein J
MNTAKTARGFTLLEMLIGLTLVGFILALLFAGLRLGSRSWDAGEQRMTASVERGVILDFIRRGLTLAYPMTWRIEEQQVIAFAGERTSVAYIGPVPSHDGTGGNQLISLGLEETDTGKHLVMRWRLSNPTEPGFDILADADKKILIQGLDTLELAYFGKENEPDPPTWQDRWVMRKTLPDLIRMRITLANGEAWPEIVVAPVIDATRKGGASPGGDCILC